MKNAVFWDMMSYGSCKNRCFEGTYRLHNEGESNQGTWKTLAVSNARNC
jgi:hypothetical protein